MPILILEDELLVALELQQVLQDQGYEVLPLAATIAEAEALAEKGDVEFAVLDANIRGEVPKALAEDLLQREIPIVYVTGYDEAFIRANLPQAPRLPKPVVVDALTALIGKLTR